MSGAADGPATSDGDLTGSVKFTMGTGCGEFDYGYTKVTAPSNTAPTAKAKAPATASTGESVTFSGTGSTDAETPDNLDYSWDFGNGGSTKDAAGPTAHHAFNQPGTYDVTLLVTDPSGATDTDSVQVTVAGKPTDPGHQAKTVPCGASKVKKTGSWRNVKSKGAPGGSYCDNLGKGKGKDTLTFSFRGPKLDVMFGKGARGGAAALIVDGTKVGTLRFDGKGKPSITFHRRLTGLGAGTHTVTVAVTKGRAYLESFRA
jgi:PKD repeat protein